MKSIILLGVLMLTLAIGAVEVAESRYQERQLMSEIHTTKLKHDDIRLHWSQLILEETTLTDEAIIYQVAEQRLGMALPTSHELVYNANKYDNYYE